MKYLSILALVQVVGFAIAAPALRRRGKISKAVTPVNSTPLIQLGDTQFGTFIEGASVDPQGNLFAVGFNTNNIVHNQFGHVSTGGVASQKAIFIDTDANSSFVGARFVKIPGSPLDSDGFPKRVLLADQQNHRVLEVTFNSTTDPGTSRVFCGDPQMLQPNDLAIHPNGNVYLSGQRFVANTTIGDGDLWLCTPQGTATRIGQFGRTNGIEISPDGNVLYLSEAFNDATNSPIKNQLLRFDIDPQTGNVTNKQVFFDFGAFDNSGNIDIDGTRADFRGNLFVARNGGQQVVTITPKGSVVQIIKVSMQFPANLEFGGPKGNILHVVGRCGNATFGTGSGCVDTFVNLLPGHAFDAFQQ